MTSTWLVLPPDHRVQHAGQARDGAGLGKANAGGRRPCLPAGASRWVAEKDRLYPGAYQACLAGEFVGAQTGQVGVGDKNINGTVVDAASEQGLGCGDDYHREAVISQALRDHLAGVAVVVEQKNNGPAPG